MSDPNAEHEVARTQRPGATRTEPMHAGRDPGTPGRDEHGEIPSEFRWLSGKQLAWLPILVPLGALTLALGAAAILSNA